ncbi:hypothetical protein PVAR5_4321 [Paecilomyces variotii No. 5]|uniref:Uncharacterized protein n=1 Tax=Byssochlamys spectabilis (strain No. 5 / NBRC 109023) TaxID=1356009 RepID=V5HZZ2_BYSSN|nr:hypothetical protein PVAR5_4321 [Paecilomyces variotii No. 5]
MRWTVGQDLKSLELATTTEQTTRKINGRGTLCTTLLIMLDAGPMIPGGGQAYRAFRLVHGLRTPPAGSIIWIPYSLVLRASRFETLDYPVVQSTPDAWTCGNQDGEGSNSRRIPILLLAPSSNDEWREAGDAGGPFSMHDRAGIVMLSRSGWATVVQPAAPAADQEEKTCQVSVAAAN